MHVYIPTKGRSQTISTHQLLDAAGIPYSIVVHNEEEADAYRANPTIDPARVVVSGAPFGLCQQRQFILDQHQHGDWVVMMDDNIRGFTALAEPWYNELTVPVRTDKEFSRRFNTQLTAAQLMDYLAADRAEADARGAWLIGYDQTENWYFRGTKYQDVGYVIGKMIQVRKSHLAYDPYLLSIDDFDFTAANLAAFGRVLINHYIYPKAQHYQPGGLGTYVQRLQKRKFDCRYLLQKWPGLYRYKQLRDADPDQDLALRMYSLERIAEWRAGLQDERTIRHTGEAMTKGSTCAACGKAFRSVTAFDDHRMGEYERRDEHGKLLAPNTRRCMTDAELAAKGFVESDNGLWSIPPTPEERASLDALRARQRARREEAGA